jgi:hypothetical protein
VYYLDLMAEGKFPDTERTLAQFISPSSKDLKDWHVKETRRIIMDRPYLPLGHLYLDKKTAYVATIQTFLRVSAEGQYEFRLKAHDVGIIKIDNLDLQLQNKDGRVLAGWDKDELWSTSTLLSPCQYSITIVHAARVYESRYSGLEVRYKGPDTANRWDILPLGRLRAGITKGEAERVDQDGAGNKNKNLLPSQEILTDKLKRRTGFSHCPDGLVSKLVNFRVKVPKEMEPGFYDVSFHDFRFGASSTGEEARWSVGMGKQQASVRVVPSVESTTITDGMKTITVTGSGLDALKGPFSYNDMTYTLATSTQDHLELVQNETATDTASFFGARGLLREFWYEDQWPEVMESMGDPPVTSRVTMLRTNIEQSDKKSHSGFSERLSGLFTPPYTGTCRFRLQGTQKNEGHTSNKANLFISDVASLGNAEVANEPLAPQGDTSKDPLPFEFPTTPQVTTDWANVKVSKWISFEEGKSYPFKLERKVAGISESTGIDGWKQIGLECKSLEGKPGDSAEDKPCAGALLPKGEYIVDMNLKEYPVKLTLPKSSKGYKLESKVTKSQSKKIQRFDVSCRSLAHTAATLVILQVPKSMILNSEVTVSTWKFHPKWSHIVVWGLRC